MKKSKKILFVILLLILLIVVGLLIWFFTKDLRLSKEEKIVNDLTNMGNEIYMSYYYPSVSSGKNLDETKEFLKLKTNDSEHVLGPIDSLKLKSSMTLFDYIEPDTIYNLVLQKYYNGEKDNKTLEILSKMTKEKVNIKRRNQ